MKEKKYRPCVVGVFQNSKGQLLVGERTDRNGVWQFPQGGIDKGETAEEALKREMYEEIGLEKLKIIKKSSKEISYDFPEGFKAKIANKYRGQIQTWFLLEITPGHDPDLKKAPDEEFRDLKWDSATNIVENIVSWKKDSYIIGLKNLNITE